MKIVILISISLFFCFISCNKGDEIEIPNETEIQYLSDSLYVFSFSGDQDSTLYKRHYYNYDEKGNVIAYYRYYQNNESAPFLFPVKHIVEYNNDGNLTRKVEKLWDSGSSDWIISNETIKKYNLNGQFIEGQINEYDKDTESIISKLKEEFFFDDKGFKTSKLLSFWDFINSDWLISKKDEYITDVNGNIVESRLYNLDVNHNTWELFSRETMLYNLNGNEISHKSFLLDPKSDSYDDWVTNEYNAEGLLLINSRIRRGGSYNLISRVEYFYNNGGKVTSYINYSNYRNGGNPVVFEDCNYSYDSNGSKKYSIKTRSDNAPNEKYQSFNYYTSSFNIVIPIE